MYKHLTVGRKVSAFLAVRIGENIHDPASKAFQLDTWYHNLGRQVYALMEASEKGPLPSLEQMWGFADYIAAVALQLLGLPATYKIALTIQVA